MESLDPACTPLKHRYDSCFNLWFEGYLQPALDARASTSLQSRLNNADDAATARVSDLRDEPAVSAQSAASNGPTQRPLVTNWSGAFRARAVPTSAPESTATSSATSVAQATSVEPPPSAVITIDRRGKTRSQIKAEEYEAACGGLWRDYQGCLKAAVARNTSLTTLLEQAREEHPLVSQDGLGGTAWDREPTGR